KYSHFCKRLQALPENKYTSEDHDIFTIAGRTCIEEGNSLQVLSIVLDEKNQDIVRCMGWNLLPPLIQTLLKKEDKVLPHCLAIFNHLLEVCPPKELLIGLLEQLEQDDPDTIAESLHLLLSPLQKVLLCLGTRKASSLGMALSSVLDQVAKLPLPQTKEQEEDDVFSLCRCCTDLTTFIRPFVQEVRQNTLKKDELRTELLKFSMRTLSHPLLEVHLKDPDTLAESPLRNFATEIMNSLSAIGESLPSLVYQPLLRRKEVPGFLEEEVCYPKESLASLAHLVFVHHLATDNFPSVYSPVFCLRSNMEHELYEKSLVRVEDGSLSADLLEIRTFLTVPQNLVKVMTICPRHDLVSYMLIETEYMLKTSNHSGVEGYIIKNIKNQIDSALKPGHDNCWFEGVRLPPLLRLVLRLPDGPETDLLQYLDRPVLLLLLFQTGVWTELYKIEDSFMKPLRVGLNMSRAHYEKELHSTMDSKKSKGKGQHHSCFYFSSFFHFSLVALHSALHTFDMIESVLARIEELVEVKESV
uniref:Glomulin, FKBP associated protein a n=1 Tax=Sphaeramia orbicularis TaxID=375764 RepID=A0A672ZAM0_9TELE